MSFGAFIRRERDIPLRAEVKTGTLATRAELER